MKKFLNIFKSKIAFVLSVAVLFSALLPNGNRRVPTEEVDQLNRRPRPGRFWHFHPTPRTGGHAFYGLPVR